LIIIVKVVYNSVCVLVSKKKYIYIYKFGRILRVIVGAYSTPSVVEYSNAFVNENREKNKFRVNVAVEDRKYHHFKDSYIAHVTRKET